MRRIALLKHAIILKCLGLFVLIYPSIGLTSKPDDQNRVVTQLETIAAVDAHKSRKNVVIIGSGIAGLTAAHELNKLGHKVTILEASNRVGGRIYTHTFPTTNQYGELGAMRIPASHDFTRHYIEQVGLTGNLRKFVSSHENANCFYYIRGKKYRIADAPSAIQEDFRLSSHEQEIVRAKSAPAILGMHITNALKSLNVNFSDDQAESQEEDDWGGLFRETFLNDRAIKLEMQTLGEFLKQRTESRDAVELVGMATGLELWWDKAVSMFLREGVTKTGVGLQEIAGGFSQLPIRLADMLGREKIQMNKAVISIALDNEGKVTLITQKTDATKPDCPVLRESPVETFTPDYVICTIPFSVLRTMELQGLSAQKMEAIRNMSYASSTKVLLNFKDRFWEREGIFGGASITDQIVRTTYYPCDHANVELEPLSGKSQGVFTISDPLKIVPSLDFDRHKANPGVLLGSYNWGQDSRRLGALSEVERADLVLDVLEKIHPNIRQNLEPQDYQASVCWDRYRWTLGAFCGMNPGDMREYSHVAGRSEGRLHFAGEHCSLDHGWVQGAIRSSLRAVEELVKEP